MYAFTGNGQGAIRCAICRQSRTCNRPRGLMSAHSLVLAFLWWRARKFCVGVVQRIDSQHAALPLAIADGTLRRL